MKAEAADKTKLLLKNHGCETFCFVWWGNASGKSGFWLVFWQKWVLVGLPAGEKKLLAKVGFGWSFRKIEFWLVCRLVSDCGVQFAGDAPPELFGLESSRKTFQKVELLGSGTLAQPRKAPAAQATCGELQWVTRAKVLTRSGPKGLKRWSLCA